MNTDICNINLHILAQLYRGLKQELQDLSQQKRHSRRMPRNRCLRKYATPPWHQDINVCVGILGPVVLPNRLTGVVYCPFLLND
jgi:hypothetical protein